MLFAVVAPSVVCACCNTVCCPPVRVQGADLRRVPPPAPGHTGLPHLRHTAPRDPRNDLQVHDRSHPHSRQTVRLIASMRYPDNS